MCVCGGGVKVEGAGSLPVYATKLRRALAQLVAVITPTHRRRRRRRKLKHFVF